MNDRSSDKDEAPNLAGFEQDLAQLEALVGRMEAGDQTLDQAFEDYQAGVSLVGKCQKMLQFAEQKVAILSKKTDDQLREEVYQGGDEGDLTEEE